MKSLGFMSLGKGGVGCSIHPGGTTKSAKIRQSRFVARAPIRQLPEERGVNRKQSARKVRGILVAECSARLAYQEYLAQEPERDANGRWLLGNSR